MSQLSIQRRPALANQDLVNLCESLETNPRDEGAWREIFGDYLDWHVCTVVIKRTVHSRDVRTEYLAWVT